MQQISIVSSRIRRQYKEDVFSSIRGSSSLPEEKNQFGAKDLNKKDSSEYSSSSSSSTGVRSTASSYEMPSATGMSRKYMENQDPVIKDRQKNVFQKDEDKSSLKGDWL